MFVKLCLFACLVACGIAMERGDWDKYNPFNSALNSPMMSCDHDRTLNLDVSGIKVYFFDFANDFNTSFLINDAPEGILNIENLDMSRPFTMFVGGFTSHINHDIEKQMREAYKTHPDTYMIIPDHSEYTHNRIGNIRGYERAVSHIHYIGKALGEMWAKINLGGVSASNIHCVGHSLGGQILGHLGTTFTEITGAKISRVSALDPAGPCFVNSAVEDQVRAGVAEYVEVYHCNAGALGSANMLGDADFFANNNGKSQPNCGAPMMPMVIATGKAAACAHRTCVDLWTASVKNPDLFVAYSCESYKDFENDSCNKDTEVLAGAGNPGIAKGTLYFSTAMYNLNNYK